MTDLSPVYYLDHDGCVLCEYCADEHRDDWIENFRPESGPHNNLSAVHCDNCSEIIPPGDNAGYSSSHIFFIVNNKVTCVDCADSHSGEENYSFLEVSCDVCGILIPHVDPEDREISSYEEDPASYRWYGDSFVEDDDESESEIDYLIESVEFKRHRNVK